MLILISIYLLFLVIYAFISYSIALNIIRHRVEGDISNTVLTVYFVLSAIIIIASIFFFVPI